MVLGDHKSLYLVQNTTPSHHIKKDPDVFKFCFWESANKATAYVYTNAFCSFTTTRFENG